MKSTRGLATMMAVMAILVLGTGCNTAVVEWQGVRVVQPKDVSWDSLKLTIDPVTKQPTLEITKYTSAANVAAMQAQSALIGNVVQQAVAATAAALASQATPTTAVKTGVVAVPASDGTVLTAVETTKIVPTK